MHDTSSTSGPGGHSPTWWENLFVSGAYRQLQDISPEHTARQVDFALEALDLRRGQRLLDIACGIGRHSVPFAAAGLQVVGLDISPPYLAAATTAARGHAARFVLGDMRALPFQNAVFDAAVSFFSSFGYCETDEDDERLFREVARVLRPGGRLFLDTMHHDALVRRFVERDWAEIPDGLLLEVRRWDARRGRVEARWSFVRGGRTESYPVSIRVYTCPELEAMLRRAGLTTTQVWGDWNGGALTMESWRILLLAEKP